MLILMKTRMLIEHYLIIQSQLLLPSIASIITLTFRTNIKTKTTNEEII